MYKLKSLKTYGFFFFKFILLKEGNSLLCVPCTLLRAYSSSCAVYNGLILTSGIPTFAAAHFVISHFHSSFENIFKIFIFSIFVKTFLGLIWSPDGDIVTRFEAKWQKCCTNFFCFWIYFGKWKLFLVKFETRTHFVAISFTCFHRDFSDWITVWDRSPVRIKVQGDRLLSEQGRKSGRMKDPWLEEEYHSLTNRLWACNLYHERYFTWFPTSSNQGWVIPGVNKDEF